ncbi:MAG: hypothetical protein JJU02_06485 [Cryomorphaceae bacterium]|nr:hypothetical protein [Cryomorphaceae bacterium]
MTNRHLQIQQINISNLIVCLLILLSPSIFGQMQDAKPNNGLSLNLGSGTLLSIDYERIWRNEKNNNLLITSIGAGVGLEGKVWQFMANTDFTSRDGYFVSPQKVTYNIGNGNNYLELGAGGILVLGNTTQPYIVYPIIGYRFIGNNNTTFKFFLSWPISGIQTDDLGFVPFGIGLGQLF